MGCPLMTHSGHQCCSPPPFGSLPRSANVLIIRFVFIERTVLAGFDPQWPVLKLRVAGFEMTVFGYFESGDFGSDTKTVRSFSALMICLVSGRRLLRTLLIMVRLVPVFFAHAVWPPARSTSERSKQMTSLSSRNFIYIHPPPLAA
jgi:hypothetical protein